jgi:hypothetical protein
MVRILSNIPSFPALRFGHNQHRYLSMPTQLVAQGRLGGARWVWLAVNKSSASSWLATLLGREKCPVCDWIGE